MNGQVPIVRVFTEYLNTLGFNTLDELPSSSQPVNPSHVTLN